MDVSFEEEKFATRPAAAHNVPPGMAGWVISHGWATDTASANRGLIVIGIALLALAAGFFLLFGRTPEPAVPPGARVIFEPKEAPRLAQPIPATKP